MVDTNKYYYKFGEVEEEDIEGVVNDLCNIGIDQIDICTVNMLVENRVDWKRALKNQLFKKIRRSDSVVEFRGWITEVRFVSSDKFNLTLKIKSKIMVLNDLDSHVTSEWLIDPATGEGSEGTITARDSSTFTNSEDIDEPPSYTSEDTAVLIVPGSGPVSTGKESGENDVESVVFSGGASSEGTFALLNDDDDSTGVKFSKGTTQELFMEIKGSSDNLKSNVVGSKVEVVLNVKVRTIGNTTVKLEYWDGDSWEQVSSDWVVKPQLLIPFTTAWDSNIIIGSGEYISGNSFLDGSDDFRFRVILTTTSDLAIVCKVVNFELEIFTDAKYNGAYFPITNYPANPTKIVWTNVNPLTAGIDVGDTMIIGWKDTIALAEIFDEYPLKDRPFTVDIDSNFIGYTGRSFYDMSLMDCIQYFLEKQQGHYYYDHNANTLYLRKESTMITDGTLRTITESNIEDHGFDDKEETKVKEIIVTGATYKRGDGDEIHVDYSYPHDDFLAVGLGYIGTARKVLKIRKPEVKSWTEARLYAKAMFGLMNTPELSINIKLTAYNDLYVVGNKLDITGGLEGITVDDEPIVAVNTSYDVGNDLAIKSLQVGWQRTPLFKRHSALLNKLASGMRDLQKYSRQTASQKGHKLLRADGTIEGSGIIISGGELTGITLFTAANNLNIGAFRWTAGIFGLSSGSWIAELALKQALAGDINILFESGNYDVIGDSLEQAMTNKTLTLPIIGIIKPTADYELTLPVANGNLPLHTSLTDISNIENTKLSTWPGSANILTVGALGSGSIGIGFTTIIADRIADLNASKITAGSFHSDRLSGSYTGITGVGALGAGSIGSGFTTIASDRIASILTNKELTTPDINGGTVDLLTSFTVANDVDIGNYNLRCKNLEFDGGTSFKFILSGTPTLSDKTLTLPNDDVYLPGHNTLSDISNVENTQLSTWAGTANILTVGALGSGSIGIGFTTIIADRIADLDAAKIISGSFDVLRIPNLPAGKITSDAFHVDRIPSLNASKITAGTFGTGLIPSLDAAKITTGTFGTGLIPSLDAAKITTGTFGTSFIPSLPTSKITTGTFHNDRISSSSILQHQLLITALGTLTTQLNLSGVDIVVSSGDISCVTGSFSATSINIGSAGLSNPTPSELLFSAAIPAFLVKDIGKDITEPGFSAQLWGKDKNDVRVWNVGVPAGVNHMYIKNFAEGANIAILPAGTGGILLKAGAFIEDTDTVMAGSPANTQLLTALGIKNYVYSYCLNPRTEVLTGYPDEHHKIVFDPATNHLTLHAGDVSNDDYWIFTGASTISDIASVGLVCNTYEQGGLGRAYNYWTRPIGRVYSKELYSDDGGVSSYDEQDDLQIIDDMQIWEKAGEIQRDENGIPIIDKNTIPEFLKHNFEDGRKEWLVDGKPTIRKKYIQPSNMSAFSWGAIKQLHQKVKDQELLIVQLNARIDILEGN